jgi:hypothetical protein
VQASWEKLCVNDTVKEQAKQEVQKDKTVIFTLKQIINFRSKIEKPLMSPANRVKRNADISHVLRITI